MAKTTDQLRLIMAAGGSVTIDADSKTTDQLRLIAAASTMGAKLTLRNADSKTTDQLRLIAAAAPGNVIFEF